jgi:hypothetical protein
LFAAEFFWEGRCHGQRNWLYWMMALHTQCFRYAELLTLRWRPSSEGWLIAVFSIRTKLTAKTEEWPFAATIYPAF